MIRKNETSKILTKIVLKEYAKKGHYEGLAQERTRNALYKIGYNTLAMGNTIDLSFYVEGREFEYIELFEIGTDDTYIIVWWNIDNNHNGKYTKPIVYAENLTSLMEKTGIILHNL